MFINVVTVQSGWILQKIAHRLKDGNKDTDIKITVSHVPNLEADINYYADLQNCYLGGKTKCDVAYFTHAHENSKAWAQSLMLQRDAYSNLDGIVSMNERYTKMLRELGFPSDRLVTITPGETKEDFPLKKITIGVVSRGGYEGYGQFFLEDFFEAYDLNNFKFKFLGSGWAAGLGPIAEERGICVEFYSDEEKYPEFYNEFYNSIDYLLIPGLWTAGPMSMQEALSCGVPVIGADVGFVNHEYAADHVFSAGDKRGLYSILKALESPMIDRRSQVENMSWEKYSKDIITFLKRIHNDKFSK
tara:strand:+ start:4673 stop:5578 length:906 start_codon:yes stop_codon:yes gene_type:complete